MNIKTFKLIKMCSVHSRAVYELKWGLFYSFELYRDPLLMLCFPIFAFLLWKLLSFLFSVLRYHFRIWNQFQKYTLWYHICVSLIFLVIKGEKKDKQIVVILKTSIHCFWWILWVKHKTITNQVLICSSTIKRKESRLQNLETKVGLCEFYRTLP